MKLYNALPFLLASLLLSVPAQASMFGYQGQEQSDLSMFKKWQSVNQKFQAENIHSRVSGQLQQLIGVPHNQSVEAKLMLVNQRINRTIRYQTDNVLWIQNDYWASPAETLAKGAGDCDDFAILKYFSLLALGIPAANMQIVILNDQREQILHAVLAVSHEGKEYILDNRYESVYQDNHIQHYRPIYALNHNRWWRYS